MKQFCLTVLMHNDPALIEEYEAHHRAVWPSVLTSLGDSGIIDMKIYRYGAQLFMIMQTEDDFTLERKAAMDLANPEVQAWEKMMLQYQLPFPGFKPGEKWQLMDKIFQFTSSSQTIG